MKQNKNTNMTVLKKNVDRLFILVFPSNPLTRTLRQLASLLTNDTNPLSTADRQGMCAVSLALLSVS